MASVASEGEAAVGARGLSGPATAATCSGTATSSCCRSSPPRTRRPRGRCSSTGCGACPWPWTRPGHSGGRGPASPGSRPRAGRTSRRRRPGLAPARSCRSGPGSSRSTSSPTWRGRRRATSTGPATRPSRQGPARSLFVETARYWASRARIDRDGRAHIYGVIGPDEYHEPVDDNAFTNVMARWNLRRALAATEDDETVEPASGPAGATSWT